MITLIIKLQQHAIKFKKKVLNYKMHNKKQNKYKDINVKL